MKFEDNVKRSFATVLKDKRRDAGLTQEQLGKAAGIPLRTMNRLEAGEQKPGLVSIFAISEALGIQASQFVAMMEDA